MGLWPVALCSTSRSNVYGALWYAQRVPGSAKYNKQLGSVPGVGLLAFLKP